MCIRAASRVWILAALALAGCGPQRNPQPPSRAADFAKAAELIQQARRAAQSDRVGEAIELLKRASEADPTSERPHILRSQLLGQILRVREALEEARLARRLAPNDLEALMTEIRLTPPYVPSADTEALASRAAKLAPNQAEAHYYLGLAMLNSGEAKRLQEAMAELEKARQLAPMQPLTLVEMGRAYLQMGNAESSVAMLRFARQIMKQPGAPPTPIETQRTAAFWLAQALQRTGRASESRAVNAEASRLSERAREIETLSARAYADPPDKAARARLRELMNPANRT